ncbi:MAG: class 1 fructose-bisphosphatase [Methylophilaceae bacterium]
MKNEDLDSFLTKATVVFSYGEALKTLILTTAKASIELAQLLSNANLTGETAKLDNTNVQGEQQMQLDVVSNDIYIKAFKASNVVAGFVSEELADAVILNQPLNQSSGQGNHQNKAENQFLISFDPLDGSSNIAINGIVGSIFSILPVPKNSLLDNKAFLQAGKNQLAALYVIYGPATMLVISVGNGTHAFTLNNQLNNFQLTHADMNIKAETSEYAINASNERYWETPIQRYIAECKAGSAGVRGRDFNMRWMACMVTDVHRILMRGGVFLYPKDSKQPIKKGRLRLLYEANPISMLVEQAQGKSITGRTRIMDIQPTDIHERVPVILGSAEEVNLLAHYHQQYDESKG